MADEMPQIADVHDRRRRCRLVIRDVFTVGEQTRGRATEHDDERRRHDPETNCRGRQDFNCTDRRRAASGLSPFFHEFPYNSAVSEEDK